VVMQGPAEGMKTQPPITRLTLILHRMGDGITQACERRTIS
jgi:hypothetical protein